MTKNSIKNARITLFGILLIAGSVLTPLSIIITDLFQYPNSDFSFSLSALNVRSVFLMAVLFLLGLFTLLKKRWIRAVGKALAWIWLIQNTISLISVLANFLSYTRMGMDWSLILSRTAAAGFAALLLLVYQGEKMKISFETVSSAPVWTDRYSDLIIILMAYAVKYILQLAQYIIRLPFERQMFKVIAHSMGVIAILLFALISLLSRKKIGLAGIIAAEIVGIAGQIFLMFINNNIHYFLPYIGAVLSSALVIGYAFFLMNRNDLFHQIIEEKPTIPV